MEKENDKRHSATILVETDNGYQATYFYRYFIEKYNEEMIEIMCNSPNLGYQFEVKFDHFLFYKKSYGYDNGGNQHTISELIGIEEEDFGEKSAKKKCLEFILQDKSILYKTIFSKTKDSSELVMLTRQHAGWVD
ncbi:hypothetical protein ACFL0E_00445 [Nanoarchaeota archaeon]